MKHTKGPWKAVRNGESYNGTTYYDPMDNEEKEQFLKSPYVRIVNENDQNIVTNHDLFEFKNKHDAYLLASVPEMLEMLENLIEWHSINNDAYALELVKDLIKKTKGE